MFGLDGNVNITSVSLKNAVVNQTSLTVLLDGGGGSTGIGELNGITGMDLSGIDFVDITGLSPLYVMDDLTDLWLVNTVNLGAADLDTLLNNLATIQGTVIEGILYMTQANYDVFNTDGGDFLADWDEEDGHHVEFVVQPGDFDEDGDVDGADFLYWQLNDGSESGLADWQATFGDVASPITAASTGVPEPTTGLMLMLGMAAMLFRRGVVVP
jgi:hypothetical protein